MVIANLVALAQTNVKRMLAYSSIAHAGYVLVWVAAATTEGERGPDDQREAELFLQGARFFEAVHDPAARRLQSQFGHRLLQAVDYARFCQHIRRTRCPRRGFHAGKILGSHQHELVESHRFNGASGRPDVAGVGCFHHHDSNAFEHDARHLCRNRGASVAESRPGPSGNAEPAGRSISKRRGTAKAIRCRLRRHRYPAL